eukprot:scaffold121188_cov17-Tisochrysis_lutea.AAC.2
MCGRMHTTLVFLIVYTQTAARNHSQVAFGRKACTASKQPTLPGHGKVGMDKHEQESWNAEVEYYAGKVIKCGNFLQDPTKSSMCMQTGRSAGPGFCSGAHQRPVPW